MTEKLPTDEKKARFLDWLLTPAFKRKPKTRNSLCYSLGISIPTSYSWEKVYNEKKERGEVADPLVNKDQLVRFLWNKVIINKTATAKELETLTMLMGWKIEKREDILKLEPTVTDYASWAAALIARLREAWDEHGGICPVCQRPKILPQEVCMDTESEYGAEGQVGVLELPVSTAGFIPEVS